MERTRRSRPTPISRPQAIGAGPSDLYDYIPPAAPADGRGRKEDGERLTVTDDWPDIVPVTEAEIRIIEAYFGDVLDDLFGPLP